MSTEKVDRAKTSIDKIEAEQLAREQARKKAYQAREQAIDDAAREKKAKHADKQALEESKRLAQEQARKQSYLLKEKAIDEATEARKIKEKK